MTRITRLQLVLPNTLSALRAMHAAQQALPPPLQYCLQRGRAEVLQHRGNSLEPWQHSVLQTLPEAARPVGLAAAALSWRGEGGVLRPGTWMQVVPVQFAAGMNDVHISAPVELSAGHTQQLMSALQPLLSLSGFELHESAAGRWYVWCEPVLDIHTQSIQSALITRDYDVLPAGRDAPQLRRLLTEMQMLLHAHPVNRLREQQGLPPVNAVWFSGAGSPVVAASSTRQRVMSDHPYMLGLCDQLNVTCWPLPRSAAELLRMRDHDLLLVPSDIDISAFASQWLRPIMRALCRGTIIELTICLDQLKLSFRGGRWPQLRRRFSPPASLQDVLA